MGFFSDLKEDLSQAVNELMPEETEKEKTVRKMMTLLKLIEDEIINGHYLSAEMRVDQLKTQLETMRK